MNDLAQDVNPLQAGTSPPTSGQLLRDARKASGLSLEQLSARVKVSVPRLLALEEDRLEVWPDPNVVRAVAASVCRQVQLDPATVLDRMPKAQQTALILPSAELGANFRDRSVLNLRGASVATGWLAKSVVLLVGLVVLVLLVFGFGSRLQSEFARMVGADSTGVPALAAVSDTTPVLPPDAGPTDTRTSTGLAQPDGNAPPIVVAESAVSSGSTVGAKDLPSVVSPPPQKPLVLSGALVTFKATGETWIEVNDAKGVLLLRRTLLAGEAAGASGEVPLSVVVGRADHTDVSVRGQPLKLEPSLADNVARFKVQ